MKNGEIRSFSGLYFHVFGLNMEIYEVNIRIQSKYGKIRTRKNFISRHFHRVSLQVGMKIKTGSLLKSLHPIERRSAVTSNPSLCLMAINPPVCTLKRDRCCIPYRHFIWIHLLVLIHIVLILNLKTLFLSVKTHQFSVVVLTAILKMYHMLQYHLHPIA